MSQIKVTDEWLYKYVPMADEAMIREIKEKVDYDYEFSPRFERKMKRLIWKEAHMWLVDFCRFLKKAAIVFICILSVLFALTMSVEAYRYKFFQTVKEIWEDSVIYKYFTEYGEGGFREREPMYLPEGYTEVRRVVNENSFIIEYQNDSGAMITWYQMLATDEKYSAVDVEYEMQETREIKGDLAVVSVYADESIGAYYEHERYVYILTADNLTLEDVYHMFESIE